MQHKNYITLKGYNALLDELNGLLKVERPQLVQTLNWAAGNGDRSENGDYIYGKRRLREVDKRIYQLNKKLENAEVVDFLAHTGSDKVFFGAKVTVLRGESITQVVTIVGQDEIDPLNNHISWTSPLARSLLGRLVGDEFEFHLGGKVEVIEIISVSYG